MEPNEERNLFFTLKTPPEMLKDTSAIISVRGVYVPDVNYDNHKVKDMEMEIVTSHDPNKMSSNSTFMNYRLVRFKTLKYKIKFQIMVRVQQEPFVWKPIFQICWINPL